MKKILIQLDTDKFPSTFDFIVAHDAGADVVQSYGAVTPGDVRGLILSACFTRGIPDLQSIAVWIGGSDVEAGEQLLREVRRAFFGPFKVSVMLDSNGCNTTASTAIAKLRAQRDLHGRDAFILGPGPVGMRAALLLAGEGCRVCLGTIPPQLLGPRYDQELARRTLEAGRKAAQEFQCSPAAAAGGSMRVEDVPDIAGLDKLLDAAEILVAAGPAGLQVLPFAAWASRPRLAWLLDFNLTEPLGIEGIKPSDDFAAHEGKRALGALAIGNPKMKVHRACVAGLFERNDLVLNIEGVYKIARQLV
jgi:pimeloyl-ACP methyl ester carboxylesterase